MPSKDRPARPVIEVQADQGEFMHHAEGTEEPCVTRSGLHRCTCGLYDLKWVKSA